MMDVISWKKPRIVASPRMVATPRMAIALRMPMALIVFIFVSSLPFVSKAENPLLGTAQTMDPRAMGVAGAMIAAPGGTNGVYLNPASIAIVPLYHAEGVYQFTSRENMHMGGAAIVDSATKPGIGAGVSFNYSGCNSNRNEHDSFDGRLALAGVIAKIFSLGLTGRYLRVEQNISSSDWGPSGTPALPASGSRQMDGFTMDAGGLVRLADMLTIGVTGYNLTNTESAFAPIMLGAGASLTLMKMLYIEADGVFDFTSHDKMGTDLRIGGELLIADIFVIRVGYQYDFYYLRNVIAGGLGYVHPNFGIDVGFTQEIMDKGRTAVSIGIKFFIPQ
jgi:hypothetical protein